MAPLSVGGTAAPSSPPAGDKPEAPGQCPAFEGNVSCLRTFPALRVLAQETDPRGPGDSPRGGRGGRAGLCAEGRTPGDADRPLQGSLGRGGQRTV